VGVFASTATDNNQPPARHQQQQQQQQRRQRNHHNECIIRAENCSVSLCKWKNDCGMSSALVLNDGSTNNGCIHKCELLALPEKIQAHQQQQQQVVPFSICKQSVTLLALPIT